MSMMQADFFMCFTIKNNIGIQDEYLLTVKVLKPTPRTSMLPLVWVHMLDIFAVNRIPTSGYLAFFTD